jgi:RNA polymerase sigma factor (sigma-70 family)
MKNMKQIEMTVSIRNNLLKERRLAEGLSQGELSVRCGFSRHNSIVSSAECFRKVSPETKKKIANYFCVQVEDIFPEELVNIERNEVKKKMYVDELKSLLSHGHEDYRKIDYDDLKTTLDKALNTLTIREKGVIVERFGLNTGRPMMLEEIARKNNVTKERIRQIEKRAIGRLKFRWRDSRDFLDLKS